MKKCLILDMGGVLFGPTSGDWIITNEFKKNVDMKKISKDKLEKAMLNCGKILDEKMETLEEEYVRIKKYYKNLLENLDYNIPEENLEKIVNNFVYAKGEPKCYIYRNVKEDLEKLSKKYTVLMLSDNWPCAFYYLKKYDIEQYFTKVYISSLYGEKKQDKVFFDYPIKDFDIKENEALFIDDNEDLLDIAVEKGLSVLHMDRDKMITSSKYKVIHDFSELI